MTDNKLKLYKVTYKYKGNIYVTMDQALSPRSAELHTIDMHGGPLVRILKVERVYPHRRRPPEEENKYEDQSHKYGKSYPNGSLHGSQRNVRNRSRASY